MKTPSNFSLWHPNSSLEYFAAILRNLPVLLLLLAGITRQVEAGVGICFASSSDGDVLTSIGANGRNPFPYSDLFALGSIEALALSTDATTLFATDDGEFGFIDLVAGGFVPIGAVGMATIGSDGPIIFDDVDGLDFDPTSGILYGTQRRGGVLDVLLQIDPMTGAFIPGIFGGSDYLLVASSSAGADFLEVDDIAIDPTTGQMYASVTDSTNASRLVLVDKATGAVTDIGEFTDASGTAIGDMEGLTFSPGGILYGSTGDTSAIDVAPPENSLWTVDRGTGQVRLSGPLTTSTLFDIEDYEGLACLDTIGHKISGHVFADSDMDGVFESGDGEVGQAGVFVRLYEDLDMSGTVGCCDFLLYAGVTDLNGFFEFEVFPTGDFVLETDLVTYPAGAVLTTDNVETAVFGAAADPDDTGNDFGLNMAPTAPSPLGVCYTVADDGDYLTAVGTLGYGPVLVGDLDPLFGGLSIEAIAFDGSGVLFATDADTLGTIDLATGLFTPFGSAIGSGDGADGVLPFDDVDGLEFDPLTGFLYGTVRRDLDNDLLIRINPTTGLFVSDAFGAGVDYVVLDTLGLPGMLPDVEDIAIDPSDGQMYGAVQDVVEFDTLILINKATGAVVEVDLFRDVQEFFVEDVEGLTFAPDGKLYATTGNFSFTPLTPPENTLYLVDKATGYVTELGALIADPDPAGDHESVACLTVGNLISGFVFGDDDLDGIFETGDGETGFGGVLVSLYNDDDSSGTITPADTLLAQIVTLADGSYAFGVPAFGSFLTSIDTAALPAGFALTTDNLETASFAAFSNPPDTANNFGFSVADISVTKTVAGSMYTPGSTLVFSVVVLNSGPNSAANVLISDPAPTGTTISGWNCMASGGAICPNSSGSGDLSESAPSLPNGGALTYEITLQIPAGFSALVTNEVTVSSDTADPDSGDLMASDSASAGPAVADLSVTKTANQTIYFPSALTPFVLVVSNLGPSDASGVQVSDEAPPGTTVVDWTCVASAGATCPNDSGTGDLNEVIGILAAGESVTYTVNLQPAIGYNDPIENTASVSSATADPDADNNAGTVIVELRSPEGIPLLGIPSLFLLAGLLGLFGWTLLRRGL